MSRVFIIPVLLFVLGTGCRKDRVCECKSTDGSRPDKQVIVKDAKTRDAEHACEKEDKFWSPAYDCELK